MLNQIKKIKRETERKFLLDAYHKKKKYIEKGDVQALEGLITRINGLYDGLSNEAQRISNLLTKEIIQEVKNYES